MTLHVHTARISYRGPDRLDITRRSGGKEGHLFAPSWRILGRSLGSRKRATRILADAQHSCDEAARVGRDDLVPLIKRNTADEAERIEREAWSAYVPAYLDEMAESRERHPDAWTTHLGRPRVVLVCYCPKRERCHRGLLAELLVGMGAVDEGELGAATNQLELKL